MAVNFFMTISNGFIKRLLQSRLHGMMSNSTMLVTVKGRKSGKSYTTPVNYLQEGDTLYTTSDRGRTWWRNLRGGAEVSLRVRAEELQASGEVIEDDAGVTAQLGAYLAKRPDYARYFGVSFTPEGQLNLHELEKAATSRVMVIFRIQEERPILLNVLQ